MKDLIVLSVSGSTHPETPPADVPVPELKLNAISLSTCVISFGTGNYVAFLNDCLI